MALLLFPAQAARNAPEKDVVRSTQQEESPSIHVDIDRDELDVDMDVQVDVPDVEVELDEPQIEMDVDSDEPEMNADFDQEDVDSEEIDPDEASLEHEQETIQKSFAMPAGAGRRTLEIDNIWGSFRGFSIQDIQRWNLQRLSRDGAAGTRNEGRASRHEGGFSCGPVHGSAGKYGWSADQGGKFKWRHSDSGKP
jgi:hypothetical protein